jgi:hypothetical protein
MFSELTADAPTSQDCFGRLGPTMAMWSKARPAETALTGMLLR